MKDPLSVVERTADTLVDWITADIGKLPFEIYEGRQNCEHQQV